MIALTCRLGLGVRPDMPRIEGVVMHAQTRFLVDPEAGQVLGKDGEPIGIRCSDGYVRLGQRRSSRAWPGGRAEGERTPNRGACAGHKAQQATHAGVGSRAWLGCQHGARCPVGQNVAACDLKPLT